MQRCLVWMVISVAIALAGCSREDDRRGDSASRQAGRDAYRLSQEAKRAAEKAEKEVREAGKNMREGWNEAKHENKTKAKAPDPPRRREER